MDYTQAVYLLWNVFSSILWVFLARYCTHTRTSISIKPANYGGQHLLPVLCVLFFFLVVSASSGQELTPQRPGTPDLLQHMPMHRVWEPLDMTNPLYERLLSERPHQSRKDFIKKNIVRKTLVIYTLFIYLFLSFFLSFLLPASYRNTVIIKESQEKPTSSTLLQ